MITKEEAELDLKMTNEDIDNLHQILSGMRAFGNTDQERKFLRLDIARYASYLSEALQLKSKIEACLLSLGLSTPPPIEQPKQT